MFAQEVIREADQVKEGSSSVLSSTTEFVGRFGRLENISAQVPCGASATQRGVTHAPRSRGRLAPVRPKVGGAESGASAAGARWQQAAAQ